MKSLEIAATGRDNNLNLLRFLAATAVIYAHAYGIQRATENEPFNIVFGYGLGDFAVDVFFFLSGFLVCKSWLARQNVVDYVWARCVRILPALWLSNVVFAGAFGAVFTTLPLAEYYAHPLTVSYLLENSTMLPGVGSQPNLPGVFVTQHDQLNTPLWTLAFEFQMYGLLAILGMLKLVHRSWMTGLLAGVALVALAAHAVLDVEFAGLGYARFVYFFFAGATVYNLRRRLTLSPLWAAASVLLVLVVVLCSAKYELRQLALAVAAPAMVTWLAYVPAGAIRRFNSLGDYSYGMYILAHPFQMLLREFLGVLHPVPFFVLCMFTVLPLAVLSWHGIESRALKLPQPEVLRRLGAVLGR